MTGLTRRGLFSSFLAALGVSRLEALIWKPRAMGLTALYKYHMVFEPTFSWAAVNRAWYSCCHGNEYPKEIMVPQWVWDRVHVDFGGPPTYLTDTRLNRAGFRTLWYLDAEMYVNPVLSGSIWFRNSARRSDVNYNAGLLLGDHPRAFV